MQRQRQVQPWIRVDMEDTSIKGKEQDGRLTETYKFIKAEFGRLVVRENQQQSPSQSQSQEDEDEDQDEWEGHEQRDKNEDQLLHVENPCLGCNIDMGPLNPRQLCGKTKCLNNDIYF